MFVTFSEQTEVPTFDICIVGAGPIGIAMALACEDAGVRVMLVESGQVSPDAFSAALSAGHHVDPVRHAAPDVAICRSVGGTSRWWGGRCVPYDDIDFADRPFAQDAAWPIPHEAVKAWYGAAASYFGIGEAEFEAKPQMTPRLDGATFNRLERWPPEINMGKRHHQRLETSERVVVLTSATVVGATLSDDGSRVTALSLVGQGAKRTISPPITVLAAGGLETARLLLAIQRRYPKSFCGEGGPLGRHYMGHISGKIADIVLENPKSAADHDFFLDGVAFVRRRFALTDDVQMREGVLNTAFWADNPPFHAVEHKNGVLSLVWMALTVPLFGRFLVSEGIRVIHVGPTPERWGRHIWNVLRSPWSTLTGILKIFVGRFLSRPKRPGFLIVNDGGRYALHFHGEHAPCPESRATLSEDLDALGLPYLNVDLRFTERDAESVVRSHELLDQSLRKAGIGYLAYRLSNRQERLLSVMDQASDGFHHAGLTRMSAKPEDGVVNADCRLHDVQNLYIASCSVLPSSGQANPTFVGVALALRLANHLAEIVAGDASNSNNELGCGSV